MTRSADSRPAYQDQSANELRLVLVNGPVDLRQFTVLDQASLTDTNGPLTVRASIIGASHCLEVIGNGQTFTEVFACCPVHSDRPTREYNPWTDLTGPTGKITVFPLGSPVREYACKPRLYAQADNREMQELTRFFRDRAADLNREPNGLGLSYRFPGGPDGQAALTTIKAVWFAHRHLLLVESLHDYPNEGRTAFTETRMVIDL